MGRVDAAQQEQERAAGDLERLLAALSLASGLLDQLAELLPEPSGNGPATGTIGRHAPDGSEPWNTQAADAYFTIYHGIRKVAVRMRYARGADPGDEPPNTRAALISIRNQAPALPASALSDFRREIEGWVSTALRIRDIDEEDSWVPVPRAPGAEPPCCPYCKTLSLRLSKAREEVRCFFPGCLDADHNPTRARMERGRSTGEGVLVFGDGTIVAYRESHDDTGEQ